MEFKYEVTEEDYIRFNIYHAQSSKSHRKTYTMLRYLLPLLCGVAIFFTGSGLFNQPRPYWAVIAILFITVWTIRFPKSYEKLIKKSAKDMLKDDEQSSMISQNIMVMGGDSIKVISEYSTEITSKDGIQEVKVFDDMILIYLNQISAHIVPTRYFTEEVKAELLKELAAD